MSKLGRTGLIFVEPGVKVNESTTVTFCCSNILGTFRLRVYVWLYVYKNA